MPCSAAFAARRRIAEGRFGGEVEADDAGSGAGEDAVGAEQDGLEFGRAGERGEDHLTLGGDGGGGLGPGCAELDQVGGVLLDEVVDDDAVAALDDVGAHGVADIAGADEADVHGGSLSWRVASAPEPQGTRPRISAVAIAVVAVVGHGQFGREGSVGVV